MSYASRTPRFSAARRFKSVFWEFSEGLENYSPKRKISVRLGTFGAIQRCLSEGHFYYESGIYGNPKHEPLPGAQGQRDLVGSMRTAGQIVETYSEITGRKIEVEEGEPLIRELSDIVNNLQTNQAKVTLDQANRFKKFCDAMIQKAEPFCITDHSCEDD